MSRFSLRIIHWGSASVVWQLRRAMIDFSLKNARTKRYRHAARHLLQCESLAREIADYGRFEAHDTYLTRLRSEHDRKTSFWSLLT